MKKIFTICILIVLVSCKKDEEVKPESDVVTAGNNGLNNSSNVLICNEGNFGWGNSTISLYNIFEKKVRDSVYYKANNYGLGDVCQSATLIGNKLYLAINNSGKIEVVNYVTFKSEGTISNLNSPRYILPVGDNKAYVSDLYDNKVSVIDLSDNSIIKTIPCRGWTEEMVKIDEKVYITNIENDWLYVVNTSNDQISDSILVGNGVGTIQKDSLNNLWALRANDSPALIKINTDNSITEFSLDPQANPSKLRYNATNHSLYFLKGNVCEFNISSESFKDDFITSDDRIFYGLGINPNNGNIYVSDAKDFVQTSVSYVYNTDGSIITNFNSGINSGFFIFKN